jgi:aminoglycoside 3-N-acetyltransferase
MWSKERIIEDLRDLRVLEGDALIVHASMRAVGEVEGGADAVIDALLEVVGPEGTVMAPAFNMDNYAPDSWVESLIDPAIQAVINPEPYNPDGVCARQVGVLPTRLAARAEARRSRHPILSFTAVGRNAAFLTENVPVHYPLGTNSPLARLYQLNGGILLLGVDHTVNTALHTAEIWGNAPYARRTARVRTGETSWEQMEGSPECSAGFGKIERVLRQARILRTGHVGNAPSQYMRIQQVVSMGRAMLEGRPDSLLCDDPNCRWCVRARKYTQEQDA